MNKNDARKMYTDAIALFISKGFTVLPDDWGWEEQNVAHIDLSDGKHFTRVTLRQHMNPKPGEEKFYLRVLDYSDDEEENKRFENWVKDKQYPVTLD